jgi:cell division protein FtsB
VGAGEATPNESGLTSGRPALVSDLDRDDAEAEVGDDTEQVDVPAADEVGGSAAEAATSEPAAASGAAAGESGEAGDSGDRRESGDSGESGGGGDSAEVGDGEHVGASKASSGASKGEAAAEGSGERKAYEFGDGPAPIHTGDQQAVSAVVRPIRSASKDEKPKVAGIDSPESSPVRALRVVQDLSLDRLLGADPETREARNAKLRRAGIGVGTVALAGVLVYAVFPVRTALDQRAAIDRSHEQIEMLRRANDRLEDRAESLRTDEEIERLAREQYGLVKPGEESYGVLPPPESTTTTTSTTAPPPPTPTG